MTNIVKHFNLDDTISINQFADTFPVDYTISQPKSDILLSFVIPLDKMIRFGKTKLFFGVGKIFNNDADIEIEIVESLLVPSGSIMLNGYFIRYPNETRRIVVPDHCKISRIEIDNDEYSIILFNCTIEK